MKTIASLAGLVLWGTVAMAQTTPLDAAASNPSTLGLMDGSPPKAPVRWDDASMWRFPNTRWAFAHWRELMPTAAIRRGPAAVALPRAERNDLDSISFSSLDGKPMTWASAFDINYTDGIVVLHKGVVVYERYRDGFGPADQHIVFSVTKSFVGTLAEILIAEGKLDPARDIASYVPELAGSGFGDASVRQVLDMRTGLAFTEDYVGKPGEISDVARMSIASGGAPPPNGYTGPLTVAPFLAAIAKSGEHGGDFVYRTPNTQALAWVLERVTGHSIASQIESRFWSKMGMEQDAAIQVDRVGTAFSGGGMTASLRDMARFGEMIRQGGRWQARQLIPPAALKAIMAAGDPGAFAATNYPGMPGGSYASQWWHRATGQVMAVGVHGQAIYIDPAAELVIARVASFPVATNRAINPTTLPAYDAVAAALMKR